MLDEALDVYVEAANHYAAEGRPLRITRAPNYWLKRLEWAILRVVLSVADLRRNVALLTRIISVPAPAR